MESALIVLASVLAVSVLGGVVLFVIFRERRARREAAQLRRRAEVHATTQWFAPRENVRVMTRR